MIEFFLLGVLFAFYIVDSILFLTLRTTLSYMPFVASAYYFVKLSERRKKGSE